MRNIRTVAAGLLIAAGLLVVFLAHAVQFLASPQGLGFARAMRDITPQLANLAGLDLLPGAAVVLICVALGLLTASYVVPFVEDAVESLAAVVYGIFTLVRLALGKLRTFSRE